jgi:hypothetical protein
MASTDAQLRLVEWVISSVGRHLRFTNVFAASEQSGGWDGRAGAAHAASVEPNNLLLHHVVSDLDGDTGLAILDAILAGERDPKELVKLRHARCSKSTAAEMEQALKGDWREEHLFV